MAQWDGTGFGLRVVRTGRTRRVRTKRREDVVIVMRCIATTWICTKSFWFLRPTDDCYPLVAEGASGFNRGGEGLAIFTAVEPPSVGKKGLTSIFRITI